MPKNSKAGNAAKAASQQRGRPFAKGQSGNPAGRPIGSRHKASLAVEALLDGEAEALTRKAVDMAIGGDTTALRLCLERLAPPRRERPIPFALPAMTTVGDAKLGMAAVIAAVASGELTTGEAAELTRLIEGFAKTVEAVDLEERLQRIEERLGR